MLSISREAYGDPRFKLFTNLPEDTYEAFLSAPVIVRDHVAGVINVQHREPHFHSGGEMELLTTVGEQIGCLVALAQSDLKALDTAQVLDLVMSPARDEKMVATGLRSQPHPLAPSPSVIDGEGERGSWGVRLDSAS